MELAKKQDCVSRLAWNNLGSIALRNQDYPRAYRILQDSIKADYENWNVWDNYQHACQRVKDFEEEMHACHRLLELRGQLNVESLGLLVAAVIDGVTDIHGNSSSRLIPKVKALFGAMTAKLADNTQAWYLYGKLQASELSGKNGGELREILESVIQKFQRAYRYAVKDKDWEKEENTLMSALVITEELASMQISLLNSGLTDEAKRDVRSSCRVLLDNFIAKVEKAHRDDVTGDLKISQEILDRFQRVLQLRMEIKQ